MDKKKRGRPKATDLTVKLGTAISPEAADMLDAIAKKEFFGLKGRALDTMIKAYAHTLPSKKGDDDGTR